MIPQVQDDERQPAEEPLSPGWFGRMLAPARWWRNSVFVQVSGAVLLFLGGLLVPTSMNPLAAGFFAGVSGAIWIESWWACLISPLAFGAGDAIRQLLSSGFDATGLVVLVVSACFGAALCIAFFKRTELWRRIRGKSH